MSTMFYDVLELDHGWVGVLASERGIRRMTVPRASPVEAVQELGPEVAHAQERPGAFHDLHRRLRRHFLGERVSLDDPLDLDDAPPFFRAAWEACRTIRAGETRSYAWLAAAAGRPGAARAAGQAMAKNRVAVLVPCHRVIGSDGSLHGYGGGLSLKASLLKAEGHRTESQGLHRPR